ncbi:MAG: abortive infection system antitoxin AbiGi family protein [Cycloclasticus sp.]
MLLHFTKGLSNVESILKSNSLRLSYCSEYFGEKEQVVSSAAHPMVCFSEYRGDELESKVITYGSYAIAFTKNWARRSGLSPVLYVEKNSQAAIGISNLLRARQKRGKDAIPENLRLPIMQVKCFTKHETGYNSYSHDDDFCFKSENEWRYVPTKKQIAGNYISLNKSTFIKSKEKYNNRLLPYPLKFNESAITAIYVRTEEEKLKICKEYSHLSQRVKLANWS